MMPVWRLSVAYIGPKSRTERPRKTEIGTEVAHVTRDSDTTFKVKRSKVTCRGGVYCGGLPHSLFTLHMQLTHIVGIWMFPCTFEHSLVVSLLLEMLQLYFFRFCLTGLFFRRSLQVRPSPRGLPWKNRWGLLVRIFQMPQVYVLPLIQPKESKHRRNKRINKESIVREITTLAIPRFLSE